MTQPSTTQRYEILVGLHVSDQEHYTNYRSGMTPILKDHGGYFRYDYTIDTMLQGNADEPHNRVFVLSFPDQSTMERFFSNEDYKAVRAQHFDPAVESGGILAAYACEVPDRG
ncbi:MAG: DUF1330 domain-containing protein [Phycisphaerales bacterium]|nr:DUF1330 domain-containing protein [Phycisphaerales bacterium]